MKLLVLHGSSANFGDTAMLEGVVLNLLRNLPAAELFVADRSGIKTGLWALSRVHKQTIPRLIFPCEDVLAEARYLWRYDARWRRAVHKWLALGLERTFSAKTIRVADLAATNLHEFCARFDALHMVGGGYLTDTFPDLLVEVFCWAQTFSEQGKPILLTGQQVGPFRSRILRAHTRRLLTSARFTGLREPTDSVELCRKFHLDPKRFRVIGDDSFGLPCPDEAEISACLATQGLEPGKFLAFNVRVGPYAAGHNQYLQFVARLADELARAFRVPILIVPIAFNETDSDDRSGEELLNRTKHVEAQRIGSGELTSSLVRGLLGKALGAIGVSYHFCTFALSQGIPAVCLYEGDYYSQKARGICGFWQDRRLAISLQKADVSSAVEQVSTLLRDLPFRTRLRQQARTAVKDWHKVFDEQVQENFEYQHPLIAPAHERLKLPARSHP